MDRKILKVRCNRYGDKYALCSIKGGTEYVVWGCNKDESDFYWGHYFTNLEDAEKDLRERCSVGMATTVIS